MFDAKNAFQDLIANIDNLVTKTSERVKLSSPKKQTTTELNESVDAALKTSAAVAKELRQELAKRAEVRGTKVAMALHMFRLSQQLTP